MAKNTTYGVGNVSVNVLTDQGILRFSLLNEIKKDYMPYLVLNSLANNRRQGAREIELQKTADEVQDAFRTNHAAAVKVEFDRKKKILDDRQAEAERIEAERKRRRERRRKLRLFVAKEAFLGNI